MRRPSTNMAAGAITAIVAAGIVVGGGGPGIAAASSCSTSSPANGADVYNDINCGSTLRTEEGDTANPAFGTGASSVNVARSSGVGNWKVFLWDNNSYTGNMIGITNASTSSSKFYNLTNLGRGSSTWNDVTRSICVEQATNENC